MDVRLRPGTLHDVDIIVRQRVAMLRDMHYVTSAELDNIERVSCEYFTAALADGTYNAVLAEAPDGQVIGGGGVVVVKWPGTPHSPRATRAWILNMYVEPAWRRRGIAAAILQGLLDWCRRQGFVTVSLHASDEGRALYEKFGFQPTTEMRVKL